MERRRRVGYRRGGGVTRREAPFHPELSNDFRIHRWFLDLL